MTNNPAAFRQSKVESSPDLPFRSSVKRSRLTGSILQRGVASLLFALVATSGWPAAAASETRPREQSGSPPPAVRFAVLSDLHLHSRLLGNSGAAFEAYLAQDPKLLRESEAILQSAIKSVVDQGVKFVIVPGDLTKDGEVLNHVRMTQYLAKLRQHGIQVFVVPGNHDLNNPDAVAYCGDQTRAVPSASPRLFRALYHPFGYGQAIDHAPDSLSYVAEPARGLWLLAIDSTDSAGNAALGHPKVGGRVSPQTLDWVLAKLQRARALNKRVIAFMHHGVNLNFMPQALLFPDYLVDDWARLGPQLASAGLKVVFTGHYHSQDVAFPLGPDGVPTPTLYDVETGSLVTYPCPFRIATLNSEGALHVETRHVTQIDADTGGVPFPEYAANFMAARLPAMAAYQLMALFGMPADQAFGIAPLVAQALMAGYAGDESPSPATQAMLNSFVASPEPLHTLGMLLWGLWIDMPPTDNEVVVPSLRP